jgi:hypothetical protein
MINLLPPDVKQGFSYGRRNVGLGRWVAAFLIALVGLGALATYGTLSIHQSSLRYQKDIATTEDLFREQKFSQTQRQVKDIAGSFKLVVKVLGNEVLFSKLLKQIGATIPPKSSLTGLTINQAQSAIDISASAADYATATQIQVNLSDPENKIFSRADIISISCVTETTDPTKGLYPCSVNIRALFAANNPYLFVNSKGSTK